MTENTYEGVELLNVTQVAEELNISCSYAYDLINNGVIPSRILVTRQELEEYKAKREKERQQALTALTEQAQELGLYD